MSILYNLDILVIFGYLLLTLSIGVISSKVSSSFKDFSYVPASLRKNKFILAATVFATAVGGGTTFGLTEKVFSENLSYVYALILTTPVDILIAFFVIPKIASYYDAISVGDIMAVEYGSTGRIISGIMVVFTSVGFLSAQISVSGYLLSNMFDIDYLMSIIISYSILILYTSLGGLRSVITNNSWQFLTMIIAIPMLTLFGLKKIGLNNFIDHVPLSKYSLSDNKLMWDTIWMTLSFSVMGCYPTLIQRALLNKNSTYMTHAMIIKTVIYIFFIICIAVNGLIAMQVSTELGSNMALQDTIHKIIPVGLRGLVIIGFLSAAMSTADTDLNVASVSVAQDIFKPIFGIIESTRLSLIARTTSMIIGSASIFISASFESIVDIILHVAGLWAPTILVPFIATIFGIYISKRGLVIGIISGIMGCLMWQYFYGDIQMLRGVFIGTIIHLFVFIINYYVENVGRRR